MSDEDVSDSPLSPSERQALRLLLRNEQHATWFWRGCRVWAGYVSGTVVGLYAIYEVYGKLFSKKVGGP